MTHTFSNGLVLDVEIVRKNNKNLYFRVKDDLKLYVTAPMYISWKEIVIDEDSIDVTFKYKEVYAYSKEALESYKNREMLRIFNEEIEMIKKCFTTLPDFTLRTRKMSTRWGVCDTRKKIVTLNTELIKKDIDLIDYVIVHELCHFFEPNHSKNFWALVSQAFPNYKEARKRLRG